ncbi:MAG: hypothetical protein ACR2N7_09250 [Acidimicrobiia bacterium]
MTNPATETATYQIGGADVCVAVDAGPRIVSYSLSGTGQLFADLPDDYIEHPETGRFYFIGGHRLWRAPERPAITYEPDSRPVTIREFEEGIEITGMAHHDGIVKSMAISASGEATVVDHTLTHEGDSDVVTAPWAITQLTVGGTAIMPLAGRASESDDVLPDRSIVLWPYTDPSTIDITFTRDKVLMNSSRDADRAKIGTQNTRGWIAYRLFDDLFVKWSSTHDEAHTYPDLGSSIECYADRRFVELETLGPLVTLRPGESVRHREVWQLYDLAGSPMDDFLHSLPVEPVAMLAN